MGRGLQTKWAATLLDMSARNPILFYVSNKYEANETNMFLLYVSNRKNYICTIKKFKN